MRVFTLYGLSEDDGKFRYIGITHSRKKPSIWARMNGTYRKSNPALVEWLDDMKQRNVKPTVTILARLEISEGPAYMMASALEKFAISYYATVPHTEGLFNKSCNPIHVGRPIEVLGNVSIGKMLRKLTPTVAVSTSVLPPTHLSER